MKSIMKVIILQTDICWANPATNQKHIEKMMEAHTGADLYVLPEMFSTGFCTQPEGVAETECESLRWMEQQARKRECAIAGSVATEEDGKYYDAKFIPTSGAATFINAATDGTFNVTGEGKLAYRYDNVVIPQNDLPIVNVEMANIPLVAKARRVAIRN